MTLQNTRHDGVRVGAHTLVCDHAATCFNEAIPIGNGQIGAMVYAQPQRETLSLNHDRLWAGLAPRGPDPKASRSLELIRKAVFSGAMDEAERLVESTQGVEFSQPYLPAGFVTLDWWEASAESVVSRHLSLRDATVHASGGGMMRRYFTSHPAQQIVMRVEADKDMLPGVTIRLGSKLHHSVDAVEGGLVLNGLAPEEVFWEDVDMPTTHTHEVRYGPLSRRYAIALVAESDTGKVEFCDDVLTVTNFRDLTLRIALTTDAQDENPQARCRQILAPAVHYPELVAAHVQSHRALYDAFDLELRGNSDAAHSPVHDVFMVNYARYLMISSSRDGTMPANLQGLWNEEVMPPWWSNYTCNINLQMNYWMAEACGLSTCHMALIDFIESLVPSGRETARVHFGCRGWVSCHQTDYRRLTTPVGFSSGRHFPGSASWSMWPFGGAWLCLHLFERFRYGQDLGFLRDRAYPVMAEAAEFLLDWLIPDPEQPDLLTTAPSTSPENTYWHPGGYRTSICKGSAMDIAITGSLFRAVLTAADHLGLSGDPLLSRIAAALGRLPRQAILPNGCLSEFGADVRGAEDPHRHLSHLFALTPGHDMDPALYDGARAVLIDKGLAGTGWALAWKAKCWARLGEGSKAHAHLEALLRPEPASQIQMANDGGGVYPNMLTSCPPMQIDANFGYGAAVLDMLVQSTDARITLLPALPDAWHSGRVRGLCLPGGGILNFKWDGTTVKGQISGTCHRTWEIVLGEHSTTVSLHPNSLTDFELSMTPTRILGLVN